MNKKIIKYLVFAIFSLFLVLFFFGSYIFQSELREKRDLTEKQIAKFESDIKNGVEIDINQYIIKDKTYDNAITNINNDISRIIEKGFKNLFKYLLKNIDV